MSPAAILDQLCQFFGGPYDAGTHTYRTPTVTNLSVVRRAFPKRLDSAEFFIGKPPGTGTGAQMTVMLPDGGSRRIAAPAVTGGRRRVRQAVDCHCYIWSTAGYAEDTQDFAYTLLAQILAKIYTDPTCGSGGFEQAGFQVGEGDAPDINWEYSQAETNIDEVTQGYLLMQFEAHTYEVA